MLSMLSIAALAFVWPRNQTRDSNLLIHPDRSTTLIQPRNACSGSGDDADTDGFSLLVVVCSGVGNTNERRAIRDSWGKDVHSDLRVVFLVGTPSGKANKTAVLTDLALESEVIQFIVPTYVITPKVHTTGLRISRFTVTLCKRISSTLTLI